MSCWKDFAQHLCSQRFSELICREKSLFGRRKGTNIKWKPFWGCRRDFWFLFLFDNIHFTKAQYPRKTTVVKLPHFYYVFTTIGCHDLPHFAAICNFFSVIWQNVPKMRLWQIGAFRGKSRHFVPILEDWWGEFRYFLCATAGYSVFNETLVFAGLSGNPGRKLGHFWDSW